MDRGSKSQGLAEVFRRVPILCAVAIVIGSIASLGALLFVEAVGWMNDALLISPRSRVQWDGNTVFLAAATVLVPTIGGAVVGLLVRQSGGRPLGPPDVIAAVQLANPLPAPRHGFGSTLAAVISLGSGASVGQYGPMVYLGALIGGLIRRFRLAIPDLPEIGIACGVAAAIATAFNAPIAGMVFAHEVVLRHYSTRAFAPVTIAATTGFVTASLIFEREPLFLVAFEGVRYWHEFLLFALLGVVGAVTAICFMHLILRMARLAAASSLPGWLRPAVAGLGVGLTGLWLPDILGIGNETLRFATIPGAFGTSELAMIIAAKITLSALCIGFGFAGGVFSPALLIGILLGAFFWAIWAPFMPQSGVAPYALAGMMALASPIIGAPLTCILILFELTHNYDITIAAMVSVVISNMIGHRAFGRSLFDRQLAGRNIILQQGRDRARMEAQTVIGLLRNDFPTCRMTDGATQIWAMLQGRNTAFVLDQAGRLAGTVSLADLRDAVDTASVAEVMRPASLVFDKATSIFAAMARLGDFVGDAVAVIDESGRYLGAVPEAALIRAYLDLSGRLREEENAAL
ncbi:chloride channel protein [Paracoccus saliphilus]|uniref:Chloride channel protein n=1 Tax=Paracoccus saliphilus TaxID=405559 RepID=A0AA45W7C9_9RHOB|nr:chloride channel protein [Paracoccus saliphilus]WCR03128.1 chloride channel protein [Paracoccus saliphilus]SIT08088.1 chloride channel protein, CIC family [Paracoccus saliphilus]